MRRFASTVVLAVTAGAGLGCSGSELAYGEINSIIVAAAPELWEQIGDSVVTTLQPSITTTVDTEEIFRVTYQSPHHEQWRNLRKFQQVLLIGSETDPWVEPALDKADRDDPSAPAILHARNVWARNQGVTILLLPEDADAETATRLVPEIRDMYMSAYRRWAVERMFVSGRDTALATTLVEDAGFRLLVPDVYTWDRQDSVYVFRNDNPDPAELIRQVTVTWKSPIPTDMQPESLLSWRRDLAERFYAVPQLHDLTRADGGPFRYRGKEAYQIQAVWQNPPGADWPAAGPFILRAIICPEQDRMYLVDAWLYAPGKGKFEYMVQLETILESFRCGAEAAAA